MRLMGLGGSRVVFIQSLRVLIKYRDVLDKQKKIIFTKKNKPPRNSNTFLCYEVRKWIWSMRNKKFLFVLVKECAASLCDFLWHFFFLFSKFPVKWIEHVCAKITQTCFCQTLWFIIAIYHRCSHALFLTV